MYVQRQLGHADISTTEHYLRSPERHVLDAYEELAMVAAGLADAIERDDRMRGLIQDERTRSSA